MANSISNTYNTIDSRDVIARIEQLRALDELADEEKEELLTLEELAEQAESSPDWTYGETLISDNYFTQYIEEIISDCYELPKEFNSGKWPWRHMSIDYEAAAEEAKQDYMEVDFNGTTFLIRA